MTPPLYQTHSLQVGETAMRTFCQHHGLRPYRPTEQYRRGDPVRQGVRLFFYDAGLSKINTL